MAGLSFATEMIKAAEDLCEAVARLKFKPPVTHVYNPLDYARRAQEAYLLKYANNAKRVVFLGMNPGPFGMAQTGVPFGEVKAVRAWMQIEAPISRPRREHPKRPVEGLGCNRSEVSGRRLWGLFAERFGDADNFFAEHFVSNYCPLAFFDKDGRNLTPDKLPLAQAMPLFAACDQCLRRVVEILRPAWLVGVGDFAAKRAKQVFTDTVPKIGKILHPSPASPAANKDWARKASDELKALGIWE
jgi:single-strand selective monofunctional uracil DNA glycosylase